MQHLEVSGAVRHIYIYIYIIRRLKVNIQNRQSRSQSDRLYGTSSPLIGLFLCVEVSLRSATAKRISLQQRVFYYIYIYIC